MPMALRENQSEGSAEYLLAISSADEKLLILAAFSVKNRPTN